jgi:eukaryotic-like serine/threonine-protein kinase
MDETEPGRLLSGRYRLTSVIGQGGMGIVWRGHDELLDRDVAVKEISWPHLSEADARLASRRAIREAQVAGRLSHRNVVHIFDIVEADGHPSIVMEYLPYRSLRDLVQQDGPLPPARAARIGLGVLAALRAAHAVGILHRDVKPANIMVGPDGRVVLTDFGIARAADSPTITGSGALLGSPSYIAPERARGLPVGATGPSGDLWGLGASLFTAVEGHPPFERSNVLATLTAVVADEPEEATHAGALDPVISGLLRKDPEQRLDAEDTERLLHLVVSEAEAAAAPPPEPEPEPLEPGLGEPEPGPALVTEAAPRAGATLTAAHRRRRRLLTGLTVLLVLVAAGVTALAIDLTGSPSPTAASGGARAPSGTSPATSPSAATAPSATASAHATASAPASAAGTAPASAAASSSATGTVPAGYTRYTDVTGFSIAVPAGWSVQHMDGDVYLSDPDNASTYLLIQQSDEPKPNPLADWQQQAANRAGSYPAYHLIRLDSVTYAQAEKAADWEFTYDKDGVPVHILNRNVLANSTHAYALYWSTPTADWTADYHYFQVLAATFRPAA